MRRSYAPFEARPEVETGKSAVPAAVDPPDQAICGSMGAKKRQTMGKIMRERERAEKRALKQEKKDEKKIAAAAAREAEALGYAARDDGDELAEAREEPEELERSSEAGAPPTAPVN
jgi:hypothetical protein